MTPNQSGWSVIGGTALGGRHGSNGAPNQDAWVTETMVYDGKEHVVMAVADGHGGSRYVRSDVGSKLAVSIALEVVRDALESGNLDGPTHKVDKQLADMPSQLVASWSQRCLAHLAENPFTEEEAARAGAPLNDDPLLSYGSTLLVGILSPNRCHLLQLGDGDSLVAMEDGEMVRPLPPDDRLTGSETTSLCLPDADRDFRVATVERPAPTLVLLSTDGYGVAFADPGWRQSVATDLLGQLRTRGPQRVAESLPAWLEESARVGGDDATVALAYRPQVTDHASSPFLSRTAQMVALATIALLIGAVGGWTAANALFDPVQSPVTTTTLAATTTSADLTTTSAGPTTSSTDEEDVGAAGGVSQGELQRAGITAGDGVAVKFYPDPENPDASIIEAPSVSGFTLVAFAWDSFWSIEEGRLLKDDDAVEIEFEPELEFVSLEYENDLLWLLSEDAEWLIAYKTGSLCLIFPIRPGAQDSDPDVTVPECVDRAGNGE
ncbi:MAG TPA: PP2C family serine/threonine-protein phosphatase [Acidimicrobiia bacterium]|nr:PP2C family serine/threonine-protein phosphatase [Acidimicrobiia bacterium]